MARNLPPHEVHCHLPRRLGATARYPRTLSSCLESLCSPLNPGSLIPFSKQVYHLWNQCCRLNGLSKRHQVQYATRLSRYLEIGIEPDSVKPADMRYEFHHPRNQTLPFVRQSKDSHVRVRLPSLPSSLHQPYAPGRARRSGHPDTSTPFSHHKSSTPLFHLNLSRNRRQHRELL